MIYLLWKMYATYGCLPSDLVMSSIFSFLYFSSTSYLLYGKLKKMYILNFKNQNLIKEMKRLLHVFPESVIIKSDSLESKKSEHFTNKIFNQRICNIRDQIKKIDSIQCKVTCEKEEFDSAEEYVTTLQAFLDAQELKVWDKNTVVNGSIQLKSYQGEEFYTNNFGSEYSEKTSFETFDIKTLKVTWEGSINSYLHVFVDTTNIRKLEEAKNSIKCQKIMFSSLSHEF